MPVPSRSHISMPALSVFMSVLFGNPKSLHCELGWDAALVSIIWIGMMACSLPEREIDFKLDRQHRTAASVPALRGGGQSTCLSYPARQSTRYATILPCASRVGPG